MAKDCRTCLDFIDKTGGDMKWVETMSREELNKVEAKTKTLKCPECGSKVHLIYIVKPR